MTSAAPSRPRRLLRAVAYGVAFAVPVSLLALVVRERFGPILRLDESVIRHTTDFTREHPTFRSVLVAWQWALQPWRLYVAATACCLWVWLRRGLRTRAWWAFITMMVTWNLALDLKYLVQRARPVVQDPVEKAPGWSFPSGHAANTAGAFTCLTLLVWPLLGAAGRRVVATGAAAVIVLTALDRVFLGVHFPSDVTAGVLVGCGIALASYAGYAGWNPATAEGDARHVDAEDVHEAVTTSPTHTTTRSTARTNPASAPGTSPNKES